MAVRKSWRAGFCDGIFGRPGDQQYTNHPVRLVREEYDRGFLRGRKERVKIAIGPITEYPRRSA